MRKNSIKNTRVNGAVQKELSTIIHSEIKDPRIHPMTSVTAVEVGPAKLTSVCWARNRPRIPPSGA